jgi:hypothetical protein
MPSVNKKILEAIEEADFPQDVKAFLKDLLIIELRIFGDRKPRYSEDYDRVINRFVKKRMQIEGEQ